MSEIGVIDRIVEENLGVYRIAQSRLQADVSQEAQVASDYRGRLVYELLQNADDAMAGDSTIDDRVSFLVTDDEMWMANTGRSLTEGDVRGLCDLGASSKVDATGHRRASIGHKGLGFKSVLEVTDEPAVYSRSYSFKLGARYARSPVDRLWAELRLAPPRWVPSMRFPTAIAASDERWSDYAANGFNTAFRFPFRDAESRVKVTDDLVRLPLTTVLFLKHLEMVEVRVEQEGRHEVRTWRVERERLDETGSWAPCTGLRGSGVYRVKVASDEESSTFLITHDEDIAIGRNRLGLLGPAWEDVKLTEVSVAAPEPGSQELPPDWRRFHVFLPTSEPCPYPILVNGAFSTDIARQHVRVLPEADDYNSHLVREAARLVRAELLPILQRWGTEAVLAALDRRDHPSGEGGTAADLLHAAIRDELALVPLLATEAGPALALADAVLPAAALDEDGMAFRKVLGETAEWQGRRFPTARFCSGRWARVAADHGARTLTPAESVTVLARLHDPARSISVDHESGGFELDPVLELATSLWRRTAGDDRAAVEERARGEPVFPVRRNDDRTFGRVALDADTAFFPPQSARQDLPLRGLRFMCHAVCWGALNRNERNALLGERIKAWTALFDVRDFRFETVVLAAVLPALVLKPDRAALGLLETLRNRHTLAAICQLAGGPTKPDRPLPYQRYQSDRPLFNLSRLPVPCRTDKGERWLPAYRVYFGADWIGDQSVERIAAAIPNDAAQPEFAYLAPPELLVGLLDETEEADTAVDREEDNDEVDVNEDPDQAVETDQKDRWIAFLSWIGVNRALRLVHFYDVEDDRMGWKTTGHLAQPQGRAFGDLGDTWTEFEANVRATLAERKDVSEKVPYLYDAHDLDQIVPLVQAARDDASGAVARTLMEHLVLHWPWFLRFADCQVALLEKWQHPGRWKTPAAGAQDLTIAGDNLWLHRLQRRPICPTSQGPRLPSVTWQPSAGLENRFGRRGRSAGKLLPVLELSEDLSRHAVQSLAERLGVRGEPSPSTFTPEDARLLCRRLEERFSQPERSVDSGRRGEVSGVYRELFELLSGRSRDGADSGILADVPLLADTPAGLRFERAGDILYAGTRGMRERSGVAGIVPMFILEADPAATAPLTRLFGLRTLEDALEWHPEQGECPFDADQMGEVREGLRALVPPLLARIRAERPSTSTNDTRILTEFADHVEPVLELNVACKLDGVPLDRLSERSYFVEASPQQLRRVFVVWGESRKWPPPADAAQGLAMALADALGINLVETFLAFIQSDNAQRRRLLDIAGASAMLAEVEHELAEETDEVSEDGTPGETFPDRTPAPETGSHDEEAPRTPAPRPAAPPVRLVRFEDLTIDGAPIVVTGDTRRDRDGADGAGSGTAAGGAGEGTGPDRWRRPAPSGAGAAAEVSGLDALGMQITVAYEVHRLRRAGHADAQAVLPGVETDGTSLVVDVHLPEAIRQAERSSATAERVLRELEAQGVSRDWPGFDVLAIADGAPDRLIELKSSKRDAYVQRMTWNEWKSARASHLRELFWLYLVGNLEADDHAANTPFVRAIKDPFGSLVSAEMEEQQVRRAVQLWVREFPEAEHLNLGVGPQP
jgi:hypothetical protein